MLVKLTTGLNVFSRRIVGIEAGPPMPVYPDRLKIGMPFACGN